MALANTSTAQPSPLRATTVGWNSTRLDFWEFPLGDDLVIARPDVHGLFLLNKTARHIWIEARRRVLPEDIAVGLVSVYGLPFHQALSDVNALLESLAVPPTPLAPPLLPAPSPATAGHFGWHGSVFEVALGSPALEDEILPRLQHLRIPPSRPDFRLDVLETEHAYALWHGAECLASEDSVGGIRARLLQELGRLSAPGRQWLALLHAGACALGDRGLIFPAASHLGKTTLAAVLLEDGFTLLSDDFAGVERDTLRIPPMPFALAVREGSWPLLPAAAALPAYHRFGEQLKFLPPSLHNATPVPAAALVFTAWRAGHDTALELLTPLESLLALKESGFWVAHDKASIRTFLDWLQSRARFRLTYSDAREAVAQIRSILKARQ